MIRVAFVGLQSSTTTKGYAETLGNASGVAIEGENFEYDNLTEVKLGSLAEKYDAFIFFRKPSGFDEETLLKAIRAVSAFNPNFIIIDERLDADKEFANKCTAMGIDASKITFQTSFQDLINAVRPMLENAQKNANRGMNN